MNLKDIRENRDIMKMIFKAEITGADVQVRSRSADRIWAKLTDNENHDFDTSLYEYRIDPKKTVTYTTIYFDQHKEAETDEMFDTMEEALRLRERHPCLGLLTVTNIEGIKITATFTPWKELPHVPR